MIKSILRMKNQMNQQMANPMAKVYNAQAAAVGSGLGVAQQELLRQQQAKMANQMQQAQLQAAKNIQVVRMPGLDSLRRPIVVVNARAWPTEKEASDLAMADVKAALAPVVQNDYALVFDLKSGAEQSTGARMAMRLLSYYRFVHPQAKHAREWPPPDNVLTMRACSTLKAT